MAMDTSDGGFDSSDARAVDSQPLEVFWRPGCPYCSRLRRELSRRQVSATWRNIWEDPAARELVRAANAGNETVPTARIGTQTLTNPSWQQLAPLMGDGPWQLAPASSAQLTRLASWSPVALFVIISLVLTFTGHDSVAWGADALAVASWWLTRPLRR